MPLPPGSEQDPSVRTQPPPRVQLRSDRRYFSAASHVLDVGRVTTGRGVGGAVGPAAGVRLRGRLRRRRRLRLRGHGEARRPRSIQGRAVGRPGARPYPQDDRRLVGECRGRVEDQHRVVLREVDGPPDLGAVDLDAERRRRRHPIHRHREADGHREAAGHVLGAGSGPESDDGRRPGRREGEGLRKRHRGALGVDEPGGQLHRVPGVRGKDARRLPDEVVGDRGIPIIGPIVATRSSPGTTGRIRKARRTPAIGTGRSKEMAMDVSTAAPVGSSSITATTGGRRGPGEEARRRGAASARPSRSRAAVPTVTV